MLLLAVLFFALGCNGFTLLVTGDVNLNPNLAPGTSPSFVWGSMLPVLRNADVVAINHESTLAGVKLSDPNVIQFEDPLNYLSTYAAAGVSFVGQANNHQFDFGLSGLATTVSTLDRMGQAWGGLGSASQVRTPRVVAAPDGTRVAFFTMVIDECWKNGDGSLYLDACTCGGNAGPPPAYQCYAAGSVPGGGAGLWYHFNITNALIANVTQVVAEYKLAHQDELVVTFLHVGPNFQWQPYPEHEQLLRNLSTVCDLVWGTSSHHIQRFEVWEGTPIIYGLGDFLFRHVVGVDDFCPLYAVPCESYRPDLSLAYQFEIVSGMGKGAPHVNLENMIAWPTQHTLNQTSLLTRASDLQWVQSIFNEISPTVNASYSAQLGGAFVLTPHMK